MILGILKVSRVSRVTRVSPTFYTIILLNFLSKVLQFSW
eukprot:UN21189